VQRNNSVLRERTSSKPDVSLDFKKNDFMNLLKEQNYRTSVEKPANVLKQLQVFCCAK